MRIKTSNARRSRPDRRRRAANVRARQFASSPAGAELRESAMRMFEAMRRRLIMAHVEAIGDAIAASFAPPVPFWAKRPAATSCPRLVESISLAAIAQVRASRASTSKESDHV